MPLLVPLFWLAFDPKGHLRRHDPLLWLLLPLAYYAYGLTRGALEGRYPYPFMDVARIGWGMAGAYAAAMGVLVAGVGLVWVDGGRGNSRLTPRTFWNSR